MSLDSFASTQLAHHKQSTELTHAGVPLLGPDIPDGYHLEGVGTSGTVHSSQPTFYYRIAPDDTGQHADPGSVSGRRGRGAQPNGQQ
ncbi:hypothetical protein [Streptomyces sp. NPDC001665]